MRQDDFEYLKRLWCPQSTRNPAVCIELNKRKLEVLCQMTVRGKAIGEPPIQMYS